MCCIHDCRSKLKVIELQEELLPMSEAQWEKDSNVNSCEGCNIQFTVSKRKHHCRYLFSFYRLNNMHQGHRFVHRHVFLCIIWPTNLHSCHHFNAFLSETVDRSSVIRVLTHVSSCHRAQSRFGFALTVIICCAQGITVHSKTFLAQIRT